MRTFAGIFCLSYTILTGMQYESRLQELGRQIVGIEKEIAIINETNYEATIGMCCGSIGGIVQVTGHNPCLPYSLGSLLSITALVRAFHHSYTDFQAITMGELEAEHRRLLIEKDALIALATREQQVDLSSKQVVVTVAPSSTLRKRTAQRAEV